MVDYDGSKELIYDFPSEFQIKQNGKTYPYYKLANNKIRFMDETPTAGALDIVEIISKQQAHRPTLAHTIADLAFMTKDDVERIDDTAARLKVQSDDLEKTLKVSQDLMQDITSYENSNKQELDVLKADTAEGLVNLAKTIADTNAKLDAVNTRTISDAESLGTKIYDHERANNPHKITKRTIGLDKVDNTADADKPISKAVKKELDKKADKKALADIEAKLEKTGKKQEEIINGLSSFGAAAAQAQGGGTGGASEFSDLEGSPYDNASLASALNSKQATISDLSDIRSGAAKGDTALQPNEAITGATKCKITYDSKGLVTGGADLQASDIPDLSSTYQPVLSEGTGIDITSNTISAKTMTGADGVNAGTAGMVPQPSATDDTKYLRGDGTWQEVSTSASVATLTDVDLTNVANGQVLIYNSTTQKWENGTVSGGASSLSDIAVAGDNVTFTPSVERNYTPNGNVTVNSSGVASGFSARTDYLKVNYQFAPSSSPWKMFWKVKTGTSRPSHSYSMYVIQGTAWDGVDKKHVQLVEIQGHWCISLSGDGTSWNIGETQGTYSVQEGTDYWLKLEFTGTNYILSYSLDGETWVEDINITSSTSVYQQSGASNYNALGSSLVSGNFSWCGDIYLEYCYYVIDGTEVWRAYVDSGKTAINAVVPAELPSQTGNSGKFLTTNGTTASWGNALANTASGSNALAILGSAASNYAHAIGQDTESGSASVSVGYYAKGYMSNTVAVGYYAKCSGNYGVALGSGATSKSYAVALGYNTTASKDHAIQLGQGTNNTANTFSVGLSSSLNVQLLDSTGEIPEARMAQVIISGASDPTTATVGTVGQLYKNTTDGGIFKCTDTTGSVYTWEELGAGGSSASYDAGTKTITL